MSNRKIAIEIIDYKKGPQEDFKTILARMSEVDDDYFFLCSSEAAIKGDLAGHLAEYEDNDKALISPTVVHILRGKRRILQHTEFLFSMVGKVFETRKVRELLHSCSFTNETDFMAKYYMQYSSIIVLDDVFYYEPSQDVIGRPIRPKDVLSFFGSLRLFPEAVQKDLLRKWTKTAKSRIEREYMSMMITKAFKGQKSICEEFGTYYRIRRKIKKLK